MSGFTPHEMAHIKMSGGHPTESNLAYLRHEDPDVVLGALGLIHTIPDHQLKNLIHSNERKIAIHALHHPSAYEPHLHHGLESQDPFIHARVAEHPKITHSVFKKILEADHVPLDVKKLAVSNKHCAPHWLKDVLANAMHQEEDHRHSLAVNALLHPMTTDMDKADFILNAKSLKMRKLAAIHLMDHHLQVLNSDVPLSVKRQIINNRHWDKENWWKIQDPQARQMAKEQVHG